MRIEETDIAVVGAGGGGAVLIGDAAHAMKPHASQGHMQAMVDAMTLVELLPECLAANDFSVGKLRHFETTRRPQVTLLQKLADEQVLYWNAANPLIACLRDRVIRTLDRNARLRQIPPFGAIDRLMAAGLLPDPSADKVTAGGAQ